jgi:hypothetical protein
MRMITFKQINNLDKKNIMLQINYVVLKKYIQSIFGLISSVMKE